MRLLPTAEVGFLGMVRNEETLEASTYAERLPEDLSGRQCYVLDPMLATGGTLAAAIQFLAERGADHITAICLLAAPEGCERLEKDLAGTRRPGHGRDRRDGREAQREGLHRPGSRRRRRPAVRRRRRLSLSLAAASAREDLDGAGRDQHQDHQDQDSRARRTSTPCRAASRRTRARRSGVRPGAPGARCRRRPCPCLPGSRLRSVVQRGRHRKVPPTPWSRTYRAFTAVSSLHMVSLASPNSRVVFSSKSSSFSMPAKPGRIDRFMKTICLASSALRIGMP